MTSVRYLTLGALLIAASTPCLAQSGPANPAVSLAPARQLTFDANALGLNVGFAARNTPRTAIGGSVGIGGNWLNYMAIGGRHFADANGLSYETKDGRQNKELIELLRASVFVRRYFDNGRDIQVGLKASGFAHFDSSDDEPGAGAFVGLDVTGMWWRWRSLQLGSEIDVGSYSEGRPELGVNIAPLLVRLSVPSR